MTPLSDMSGSTPSQVIQIDEVDIIIHGPWNDWNQTVALGPVSLTVAEDLFDKTLNITGEPAIAENHLIRRPL
jgi:hypothetical protein